MARHRPIFPPGREQHLWRRLRAYYRERHPRCELPRRSGDKLVFRPGGYPWQIEVTLKRHRYWGRMKPPFGQPHPCLGWPLVQFSWRNADDGFSETSSNSTYLDPEGWFTLEEYKIEEAWQSHDWNVYVAKVRDWRERRARRREQRQARKVGAR